MIVEYLAQQNIDIAEVTEAQVAQYLQYAIEMSHKRHGRALALYFAFQNPHIAEAGVGSMAIRAESDLRNRRPAVCVLRSATSTRPG